MADDFDSDEEEEDSNEEEEDSNEEVIFFSPLKYEIVKLIEDNIDEV